MLTLISFPGGFGEPSASSFCTKAMCLLKMSGLDWTVDWQMDTSASATGMLPALKDGTRIIPDSALIRRHLETAYDIDFEPGLSERDKGLAHALCRMAEERSYWGVVHDRWFVEENWQLLREALFGALPEPDRTTVADEVRGSVRARLEGHGIGRHPAAVLDRFAIEDMDAVQAVLGDRAFLFGDAPTAADASVGPVLSGVLNGPTETRQRAALADRPELVAYVERVRAALYPQV